LSKKASSEFASQEKYQDIEFESRTPAFDKFEVV
jgi:hypothetical protein